MQPLCIGSVDSVSISCKSRSSVVRRLSPVPPRRLLQQSRNATSLNHWNAPSKTRLVYCSFCQDGFGHSTLLPQQRALSVAIGEPDTSTSALNNSCLYAASTKAGRRLRVAVDVDEVLGMFVHALNQFVKETYGKDHVVEDFFVYEFAKIWRCSNEESRQIVHEFFKSGHFQGGIPVIPGAYEALRRLSQYCDLVVVTSRQHAIQDHTLEWIDANFPGIFSDVYFGNHWALHGTSRKKSDICKSIGADILIDDNPIYAVECATVGIKVLLYDWDLSYPWSKLPPGSQVPNISVVKNWEQVEHEICRLVLESLPPV